MTDVNVGFDWLLLQSRTDVVRMSEAACGKSPY